MSDLPSTKSAADATSEGWPNKQKAQDVAATLAELLLTPKAPTKAFVRLIAKRPALSETDLARSLEMIREQPVLLGKVLELTRAAVGALPRPAILLRWCEQAVRSQDEALHEWARNPAQDAASACRELAAWAHNRMIQKGDTAKRQETERCLLIGINVLIAGRALTPIDALRAINIGSPPTRTRALEDQARKLLSRAGLRQLSDFARIATLLETNISEAEEAQRITALRLAEVRDEKEKLEGLRDQYKATISDMEMTLAEKEIEILSLKADAEAARSRALQDARNLKARFRRTIGEKLGRLLDDAWDAMDTEPPHPDVARERVEMARETIKGELEWLDKSSA